MQDLLSSVTPLRVGIIGCGNIFPAYAKGCAFFHSLKLTACADLNTETAQARATEFGLSALSIDELLASPDIDLVINLTVPQVHAQVSRAILEAGKHVYSEKPLALTVAEGKALLDLAKEKNLRVGCAPDTFLGAGLQTCRKLIDDGWIGRPLSGTAFMLSRGPEGWHPNPSFFYQDGAGPMLDMGPYYVTALVHLLGPVASVCATTSRAWTERMATSPEQFGKVFPVDVATHYSGSLLFKNGATIALTVSFDVIKHNHAPIEIYGTEGSLIVPDPNTFRGPVRTARSRDAEWAEMPLPFDYAENSRSIGAADMAHALQSGRPHRCNGAMALHALEVMRAFELSSERRGWVDIENTCEQPAAFPLGMLKGVLDR